MNDLLTYKFYKKEKQWKNKNKIFKSDLVCGQIINTCKLAANWNGQNLKNHKCWFLKKINHKTFPCFNVVLKHVQI